MTAASTNLADGNYYLTENVTVSATIQISGTAILDLNGFTLTYSSETAGSVIIVQSSANLTLRDSSSSGTGKIAGGHATFGGGVYNYYGTFTMEGGSISDCDASKANTGQGGGVRNISAFLMKGGSITYCTAPDSGGGVYNDNNFTMENGTISGCEAPVGGGVTNIDTFVMKDGLITDCEAEIAAGVYNFGTFSMEGGAISFCTATDAPNGVYNEDCIKNDSLTGATICYDDLLNMLTQTGNLVTFKNGDDLWAWEIVPDGGRASEPTDPEKEGFLFAGWYDGEGGTGNEWDPAGEVNSEMTLYAKWICAGHKGGSATCKDPRTCDVCDQPYGEVDGSNHTSLQHVEAKGATTEEEGNIEYWYCEGCEKYFSDQNGSSEITRESTAIDKLPMNPSTGSNGTVWVILLGVALLGTAGCLYGKKRRSVR